MVVNIPYMDPMGMKSDIFLVICVLMTLMGTFYRMAIGQIVGI